jgi:uncharacterized protein DUF5677
VPENVKLEVSETGMRAAHLKPVTRPSDLETPVPDKAQPPGPGSPGNTRVADVVRRERPGQQPASRAMLDEDTRRLLDEVAKAAEVGHAGEYPVHDREVLALFDRCRGTFGAVRLLAERGFGQEALALTRSLFTESLMLMEFAAADERRGDFIIGWTLASLASFDGVLSEGARRGSDVVETRHAVARLRSWYESYARHHGIAWRKWKPDEKKLADKHGRGDEYLGFRIQHHFVHASAFAVGQRWTQSGNVVLVGGPVVDSGWGGPAALSAASSLLFGVHAVCAIFRWAEPPELESLHDRIEQAASELDTPNSDAPGPPGASPR